MYIFCYVGRNVAFFSLTNCCGNYNPVCRHSWGKLITANVQIFKLYIVSWNYSKTKLFHVWKASQSQDLHWRCCIVLYMVETFCFCHVATFASFLVSSIQAGVQDSGKKQTEPEPHHHSGSAWGGSGGPLLNWRHSSDARLLFCGENFYAIEFCI